METETALPATRAARLSRPSTRGLLGLTAVAWGIGGVLVILFSGVLRLSAIFLSSLEEAAGHPFFWPLAVLSLLFFGYTEAYRGFHCMFSPRVVARAWALASRPKPIYVVLAPIYCIGLVHATRRRLLSSWILVVAIAILVVLVRLLAQPWRGLIDLGVAVALFLGALSIGYFSWLATTGGSLPVDPDLPAVADESP